MRVLQSEHAKRFRLCRSILAFVWLSGLWAGFLIYWKASNFYVSLMRGSSFSSVTIVGLILSSLLPFLISAFAVITFRPWVLYVVCFSKAFSFALVSAALQEHGTGGSWLVQRFVMFPEIFSIPFLYTFWCRIFRIGKLPELPECFYWICLEILILSMTYRLIDPFVIGLGIL